MISRRDRRTLLSTSREERGNSLAARTPKGALEADGLPGTLDILILKALSAEPLHGWGIGQRIQQISRGRLEINQGSLYPALQRLEHGGLIDSRWERSENNRRARYYAVTRRGRKVLGEEIRRWERFAKTMSFVLDHP